MLHTSTPPSASTILLNPAKSTAMKRLMCRPDIFWMTLTRHFGPPTANAEFSLYSVYASSGPYDPVSSS